MTAVDRREKERLEAEHRWLQRREVRVRQVTELERLGTSSPQGRRDAHERGAGQPPAGQRPEGVGPAPESRPVRLPSSDAPERAEGQAQVQQAETAHWLLETERWKLRAEMLESELALERERQQLQEDRRQLELRRARSERRRSEEREQQELEESERQDLELDREQLESDRQEVETYARELEAYGRQLETLEQHLKAEYERLAFEYERLAFEYQQLEAAGEQPTSKDAGSRRLFKVVFKQNEADPGEAELEPVEVPVAPAGSDVAAPAGEPAWVEPSRDACPKGYPVKVKLSSRLFHLPGMAYYSRTRPDRCFRDEDSATAAGFKRAAR